MLDRDFGTPPLLVRRANSILNSAVSIRGGLSQAEHVGTIDLHHIGGFSVDGSIDATLVRFNGKPGELAFAPDRWIAMVLAGDCTDPTKGEAVAHHARVELGPQIRTFRTSLEMSFDDAVKVVTACAEVLELPLNCLSRAIKERLELTEAIVTIRDQVSPDGHLPFAPRLVKIL